MTKFTFEQNNAKILLYKQTGNKITAAFLTAQKPNVGDIFKMDSFSLGYLIKSILDVKDSRANSVKTLVKTKTGYKYEIKPDETLPYRKNALMTLEIE